MLFEGCADQRDAMEARDSSVPRFLAASASPIMLKSFSMHVFFWMALAELAVDILGTLVIVASSIASLAYWLGRKLSGFEARIRELEGRLDRLEERFEARFGGLEREIRGLALASSESHAVITDFLSLKGLIERGEAEYLRDRIAGVFRIYTAAPNPLTREELEFIRRVFSKDVDEITIEEAERAREIGRRLFIEDWDERGFLLFIAASFIRGYHISKKVRERRLKEKGEK